MVMVLHMLIGNCLQVLVLSEHCLILVGVRGVVNQLQGLGFRSVWAPACQWQQREVVALLVWVSAVHATGPLRLVHLP